MKLFVVTLGVALIGLVGCGGDDAPGPAVPAGSEGERIVRANACASCHGADGSGGVGPSWVGLFGSEVDLVDGSTVVADEAYLAESIRDPSAKRVAGYPVTMPTNRLTDDEIAAVVEFIKSLQ